MQVPRFGKQVSEAQVLNYSKGVSGVITGGVSMRQWQRHIVKLRDVDDTRNEVEATGTDLQAQRNEQELVLKVFTTRWSCEAHVDIRRQYELGSRWSWPDRFSANKVDQMSRQRNQVCRRVKGLQVTATAKSLRDIAEFVSLRQG